MVVPENTPFATLRDVPPLAQYVRLILWVAVVNGPASKVQVVELVDEPVQVVLVVGGLVGGWFLLLALLFREGPIALAGGQLGGIAAAEKLGEVELQALG